jgi:hypothetical protein
MKISEKGRLWLFVGLVLIVPALFNRLVPAKSRFDVKPIARLRAKQPDLVLIGDSMLPSRINSDLLEKELGCSVAMLWKGGAASAWWYLAFKNYVVAARVHPKAVCIFFRDRLLTSGTLRTTGIFRQPLESAMHDHEPAVRLVLGEDAVPGTGLEKWTTLLYPWNGRRYVQHEKLSWLALRTVTETGHGARHLERRVNDVFDVNQLRRGVTESTELPGTEATPFDANPAQNFLPHLVEVAARARIRLIFVRTKRHPEPDGYVAQSDSLVRYMAELRNWLENHHCTLIDDTENDAFTPDMFLKEKDDHLGAWAKSRSTKIYADEFRSLFAP